MGSDFNFPAAVYKGKRAKGSPVTVRKLTRDEQIERGLRRLDAAGRAIRVKPQPEEKFARGSLILRELHERNDPNIVGCTRMVIPVMPVPCANAHVTNHKCGSGCEKRVKRGRGEARRCGRTDFHHHDEAFGGGQPNGTMGSGGRPKKTRPCGHTVHIHGCSSCSAMTICDTCAQIRIEAREARQK
jgi:hypothetical protein